MSAEGIDFFRYALSVVAILLLASLSGYVSERAGVVNIGIEGMMIIGALVLSIIGAGTKLSNGNQIWAVIVAAFAAGVFALLHGFASITLKADQTISGTAINILASGVALFFATAGLVGDHNTDIHTNYKPIYLDSKNVLPLWLIVALGIALVLWVFFQFTKWGMRYKMVGENPNAVDAAGISVVKYRYSAVFLSGVIAGLGGGIFVTTMVGGGTFVGSTNGYGFLGLAILIFGQWKIIWVTLGSIAFSFLFALGFRLGILATGDLKMNATVFKIVPFLLTIFMMVAFSKWSHAPAADGVPFDKAMR